MWLGTEKMSPTLFNMFRIAFTFCSLKKLHKVQLLVDATCNVFYQANLERHARLDNVIGTHIFAANQCDLNFSWAQMEAYAQPQASHASSTGTRFNPSQSDEPDGSVAGSDSAGRQRQSSSMTDTSWRNYSHFVQLSGIDFRSSTQLVFDVLQQMIEVRMYVHTYRHVCVCGLKHGINVSHVPQKCSIISLGLRAVADIARQSV